jgi:hypothetical protein
MMRIENLLKSWTEFTCFYDRYERENFAYPEEGKGCAEVLANEFEGVGLKTILEKAAHSCLQTLIGN